MKIKNEISRFVPMVRHAFKKREETGQQRKTEMDVHGSDDRSYTLFQCAAEGILVVEIATMRFIYANPAICEMLGYTEKELTQMGMGIDDIHPKKDLERVKTEFTAQLQRKRILAPSLPCLCKDGTIIYADVNAAPVVIDGKECCVGFFTNITERRQVAEKINELYNFQTIIRKINENLLRIKSERNLFQTVCDLLIKLKDIRFAWIGLLDKTHYKVNPVAYAGVEENYLSSVKITWDDSKYGQGPIGMAVKTGKFFVIRDIENDPRFKPWRKLAMERGYAACIALPLVYEGELIGTLNLYSGEKDAFDDEEINFLEEVATDIAVGIKSLRLEKKVQQGYEDAKESLEGTVGAISLINELRDPYTTGHEKKVAQLAKVIAQEIGLSETQVEEIYITGFLHDIGKIAVPAEILTKPSRLNEQELNLIKNHPQSGYEILKQLKFPWPVAKIVLQHHERLNGSGYPFGLKGNGIILEARILAVSDVVEAMSSHRPYRAALGINKALEEISKNKGILYDIEISNVCLNLFKKKGFRFQYK